MCNTIKRGGGQHSYWPEYFRTTSAEGAISLEIHHERARGDASTSAQLGLIGEHAGAIYTPEQGYYAPKAYWPDAQACGHGGICTPETDRATSLRGISTPEGSDAAGSPKINTSNETLDVTRNQDGLMETSRGAARLQLQGKIEVSQLQTRSEPIANATAGKTTTTRDRQRQLDRLKGASHRRL